MRYSKVTFKEILHKEWRGNSKRLDQKACEFSWTAKLAMNSASRAAAYRSKSQTLAAKFRGKMREEGRIPKTSLDRWMRFAGARVLSIRLGGGRSLHQPLATATPEFLLHIPVSFLSGGAA